MAISLLVAGQSAASISWKPSRDMGECKFPPYYKYTIRPAGRGNIGHSRPVVRIVWPEGALAPEGQTIRTNWSGMTDFASARGSDCSYHIHTHIMHCWQMLFHFNRLQFKSKSNSDQLLRSGLVSLLINTPA